MKYIPTIIFSILLILSSSPWLMAIVDIYWYFFTTHSLSGLTYEGTEGFIRVVGMLFSTVPVFIFGLLLYDAVTKLEYKIIMEKK